MAETKKSKQVMDVSHPGKTPAAPNSKEVLITNRPILKDPMVVVEEDTAEENGKKPSPAIENVTIKPLSAPALTDNSADKAKAGKTELAAGLDAPLPVKFENDTKAIQPAAEDKAKPEAAAESSHEPSEKPVPADTAAGGAEEVAEEVPAPKAAGIVTEDSIAEDQPSAAADAPPATDSIVDDKQRDPAAAAIDAEAREQAKHEAEVQKLIDSKKYVLPIKTVEERRSRRVVIAGILVAILLTAAWINIALDAGLIHINGVRALTRFFSG